MKQSSRRYLFLSFAALALVAGLASYVFAGTSGGLIRIVFGAGHFADACWCLSLCLVHAAFSKELGTWGWSLWSLPFLLEAGQGLAILPGTFDWSDIGVYAVVTLFFTPFFLKVPLRTTRRAMPGLYAAVICSVFALLALSSATPAHTSYTPKPLPCVTHKGLAYSPVLTKINLSGSYTMKDLSGAQRFAYDYLFDQLVMLSPGRYKLSDGVTPNLHLDITINTDSYQHYGATLNMYVSDGSVYYTWATDYITVQKLYDDIAAKINVFVSYGWCSNCPSPCNP
ncbi:MAG: hypothetical protein JWP27_407 [Flaviaesturariibacter sp.]|nr:hypothetical protein [Flaviaesturariibacter sp.]